MLGVHVEAAVQEVVPKVFSCREFSPKVFSSRGFSPGLAAGGLQVERVGGLQAKGAGAGGLRRPGGDWKT